MPQSAMEQESRALRIRPASGAVTRIRVVDTSDPDIAEILDRDGLAVVLLAPICEEGITLNHPELRGHRDDVLATVTPPDHVEVQA